MLSPEAVLELLVGLTKLTNAFANTTARLRALEAFAIELVAATALDPELEPLVRRAVDRSFERYQLVSEQIPETLQSGADVSALDALNALRAALLRPIDSGGNHR